MTEPKIYSQRSAVRSSGHYELLHPLARGGMGDVYLARRRGAIGVEKLLVIKRVRADRSSDPRLYAMFVREARVATALSHSNLVSVFDVGRDDQGPFLAMEHVNGPNLAEVLRKAGEAGISLDPVVSAHIAAETCAGLHFAHQYRDEKLFGLVHRDVTPRNILVSMDGDVKVTDFGIAALAGESQPGRGTLAYMAPEQANGELVDARADVFAVGLLLFELLTGRRAYDGDVEKRARAALVPEMDGCESSELRRIVTRATARDVNERFPTARAMQRALSQYILDACASRSDPDPPRIVLSVVLDQLFPDQDRRYRTTGKTARAGVPGTMTMLSCAETATMGSATKTTPGSARPPRAPWRQFTAMAGVGLALAALALVAGHRGETVAPSVVASQQPPERRDNPEPDDLVRFAEALPAAAAAELPRLEASAESPRLADSADPAATRVIDTTQVDDQPATGERLTTNRSAETAAPRGFLNLNAIPWAYVSIDGGKTRETPLQDVGLSPGKHRLVLRNPVLEKAREIVVEIRPGQTARHIVDLTSVR